MSIEELAKEVRALREEVQALRSELRRPEPFPQPAHYPSPTWYYPFHNPPLPPGHIPGVWCCATSNERALR